LALTLTYFVPSVLMTLFHMSLLVMRSAVCVVDDKDEKLSKETKWTNFLTLINRYDTKSSDGMNTDYK